MSGSAMLRANGVCVEDRAKGIHPYPHPQWADHVRTFVPFIETLMPDTCAWEALFSPEQQVAHFKAVYGNRKGTQRRAAA